ncbi:methylenetetrahydrofolate reductase (NADPH) [Motilibacter rhizosphaerae]|uniref:Methylenetetrahydrofolate reductase n=1 Tax=Motilibacter rhizosphaerae TaxID=598652 RepID=A0A4V2F4B7_9ACTN|nr:methylenetetrahydrofolate reductase [Motilibacter rhizosphaerae]RZS87047.1 methylenetetrahydrofolate reductase (NADPH) [Motilibacter rhizosphaerae]
MTTDPTVRDRIARGRFVSVELLPPRTPAGEEALAAALRELAPVHPAFVAVTYGAAGSDRGRTEALVEQLAGTDVLPLPHLTCAAHRRTELVGILDRYIAAGVTSLLALHGDPPLTATEPLPPGELRYAVELARLARDRGIPCVGVAVHPEGHPAADTREQDLDHQAAKLREADFALTQFVNRAEDYLGFVDEMAARGVTTPVVPGLRVISTVQQAEKMALMSGAPVPQELLDRLRAVDGDREAGRAVGVAHTTRVARELLAGGAPGLHFYTMNRATGTLEVLAGLDRA